MRRLKSEWYVSELEVSYKPVKQQIKLDSTPAVSEYFKSIWDPELYTLQEMFYVLFLNPSLNLICWRCISIGTSTKCLVDVRLIMALALKIGARGIVVAHNHPSENCHPSAADKDITKQLRGACDLLDLRFIDHIILAGNKAYSFEEDDIFLLSQSQEQKDYKKPITTNKHKEKKNSDATNSTLPESRNYEKLYFDTLNISKEIRAKTK